MALIGSKAPSFKAPAVLNGQEVVHSFSLTQFLGKKEVVFFFYPKDFTFVCPTELLAFQAKLKEFEQRGVAVVGCSTDTEETHIAWLKTPQEQGGIAGVTYPLVADATKTIAANYGVLGGKWSYNEQNHMVFQGIPVAYRGTFFIDKEGIIRHYVVNDFPLGRNIQEMLRVISMWHHIKQYGDVCPANWEEGQETIQPTQQGIAKYLAKNASRIM